MANRRIFYACQSASFRKIGVTTVPSTGLVHGLQSVGVNTKFNLEQAFEIGQLAIYQNIENIPDVEITMEKVLDGYPLIYHNATFGASAATLIGRSNVKAIVGLSIYSDVQNSASGTPLAQMECSGVFVSSLAYNIPVQGNATEQVTLVGNNKVWNTFTNQTFNNLDSPSDSVGVNRRQHILFGSSASLLPIGIPGITASGTNEIDSTTNSYAAHIQSIKVSANLGREALYELGKKGPYHRYVNFPVEVRCDIEVMSLVGDQVQALEEATNLTNETIKIKMHDSTVIDLGSSSKLASVNYGGANAGQNGGNATMTFSYVTFNDMTVTQSSDPSGL